MRKETVDTRALKKIQISSSEISLDKLSEMPVKKCFLTQMQFPHREHDFTEVSAGRGSES